MAEPSQSGLSFFKKATPPQWTYIYSIYKEVLTLKASQLTRKGGPEELIRLDNWYQDELPKVIKARKEPHVTHEELVQITKWRLMRGKFRPRLLDLVKINSERMVIQLSKKALKKMPNFSSAIVALTSLKGIGPATASAVLAAGSPEYAPYMTEESMLSTPGLEGLDFTVETYMTYVHNIRECTDRLNLQDPEGKWNPHKVELTLWSYYLVRFLKPALLGDMPKDEQGATAGDSPPAPKKRKLEESDEDSNSKQFDGKLAGSDEDSNSKQFDGKLVRSDEDSNSKQFDGKLVGSDEDSNSKQFDGKLAGSDEDSNSKQFDSKLEAEDYSNSQ